MSPDFRATAPAPSPYWIEIPAVGDRDAWADDQAARLAAPRGLPAEGVAELRRILGVLLSMSDEDEGSRLYALLVPERLEDFPSSIATFDAVDGASVDAAVTEITTGFGARLLASSTAALSLAAGAYPAVHLALRVLADDPTPDPQPVVDRHVVLFQATPDRIARLVADAVEEADMPVVAERIAPLADLIAGELLAS